MSSCVFLFLDVMCGQTLALHGVTVGGKGLSPAGQGSRG